MGVDFRSEKNCRKGVFKAHNSRLNIDRMRAVGCWKTPINGTPSRLQSTVLKDFQPGLQIRLLSADVIPQS